MTFKKGDKVVLRKDSVYYGTSSFDSRQLEDHIGIVIDTDAAGPLPIAVAWLESGEKYSNAYSENDLAPAKQHYIQQFKQLYGQKA